MDYTFLVVAFGALVIGVVSGSVGCFSVIRNQGLLGDGISHSALAGVTGIFLVFSIKETSILLFGALLAGLLAVYLINIVIRNSIIHFDAALATIFTSFFGFSMVLLSILQNNPKARQAGLTAYIYGQASTILRSDVYIMSGVGIFILIILLLFFKEFKLISFDKDYAKVLGYPVKRLTNLLSFLEVLTIIIGLQMVGVILMSAMIIAPAVAAKQWTYDLKKMIILSSIFASFSGILGTYISSSFSKLPTGPVIVVIISIISLTSLLFAPNRGVVARHYKYKMQQKRYAK